MNTVIKDHTVIIDKIWTILEPHKDILSTFSAIDNNECSKVGYGKKVNTYSNLVHRSDASIEIGTGSSKSLSKVLFTKKSNLVSGNVYFAGDKFNTLPKTGSDFLMLVLLELKPDADPTLYEFQSKKNLNNILPGYMTKTFFDDIRIRIHRQLMDKNFSLYSLSQCLHKSYLDSITSIVKMDTILISNRSEIISKIEPLIKAATLISNNNKKLQWVQDGVVTCEELNCESCEEKPACDTIREISVSKKSNGAIFTKGI